MNPPFDETDPADEFLKGLWRENPVFIHVMGMCPALAVSNTVRNGLAMGLATWFVLVMSNSVIASMRHFVPRQVRIATYILVIATFVTIADYIIQAISLDLHQALGAFVFLIAVNCLILARAEAFASKHTIGQSFLDGLGMGAGFTLALFCLGALREVLGSGSFFGVPLFHEDFQGWAVMVLPAGGFFSLAVWLMVFSAVRQWRAARRGRAAGEIGR